MRSFNARIITPEGVAFDEPVTALTAPGAGGRFGVLAGHAAMLAAVCCGFLGVTQNEVTRFFAIDGGVLDVRKDGVHVMVGQAFGFSDELSATQKASAMAAALEAARKSVPGAL